MSKIQKALEALRKTGGEPSAPVLPRGDGAATAQFVPSPVARAPEPQAAAAVVERIQPKHKFSLNRERLTESGLLPAGDAERVVADQFRRIKRPLLQSAFEIDLPVGDNANVIMMTSALPGAGKSFCAFNLARSISVERDAGAVLVDADVLKPSISRELELSDRIGLIDYLLDRSIELSDILLRSDNNDVFFIPAGNKHPEATELIASRRMQELVAQLSTEFSSRAVIFDTPPMLLTNEAQVLAQHVGQIVMVVEARVSSQETVLRALGMLDGSKPINAILNKSRSAQNEGYGSDDYGYYPYPRRYPADDKSAQ